MGFKGRTYNNNAQPVERFDAWLSERDSNQRPLWPGTLRLSDSFYNALMVYPDTKVKQVTGGLLLMASPPRQCPTKDDRVTTRPGPPGFLCQPCTRFLRKPVHNPVESTSYPR